MRTQYSENFDSAKSHEKKSGIFFLVGVLAVLDVYVREQGSNQHYYGAKNNCIQCHFLFGAFTALAGRYNNVIPNGPGKIYCNNKNINPLGPDSFDEIEYNK